MQNISQAVAPAPLYCEAPPIAWKKVFGFSAIPLIVSHAIFAILLASRSSDRPITILNLNTDKAAHLSPSFQYVRVHGVVQSAQAVQFEVTSSLTFIYVPVTDRTWNPRQSVHYLIAYHRRASMDHFDRGGLQDFSGSTWHFNKVPQQATDWYRQQGITIAPDCLVITPLHDNPGQMPEHLAIATSYADSGVIGIGFVATICTFVWMLLARSLRKKAKQK